MSVSARGPGRRTTARSFNSFTSSLPEKQPAPSKITKPASLARRLLFPTLHADADLPPLLVSPSATPELNSELYNFIAIALRAYVHPWWTKITRYDKEFLPDITRVMTVAVRVLEARVVRTDLSPLILRDLPCLVSQHYQDYRNAQSKVHTSYAAGGAATLPQLFHQAQPHMAISADGTVEEAYIRQAMDDVLKICLPAEDFEPDSERFIIREILVKVILGGVFPRLIQPWFIHQSILTLLGPDNGKEKLLVTPEPSADPSPLVAAPSRTSSYSFQSFVIFFLSAIRSFSGACLALMHAYRHTIDTIKMVNQSGALSASRQNTSEKAKEQANNVLPGTLVPMSPMPPSVPKTPPSPPPSPPSLSRSSSTNSTPQLPAATILAAPSPSGPPLQPNYVSPALSLLHTLLISTPSPASPPRSTPLAVTHILTLLLTPFTPLISRLLPHLLYTHAFSPASLITVLQSAKGALFPGGWPAVPPPDPTPEEQIELRKELVRRVLALVPGPFGITLGTTPAARALTVDSMLEPLSSAECNAHLLVFLLDLFLLTLFPEMGVAPPGPAAEQFGEGSRTPAGSVDSMLGSLTPPRPDSRPP